MEDNGAHCLNALLLANPFTVNPKKNMKHEKFSTQLSM
jgi:hypothetical protein